MSRDGRAAVTEYHVLETYAYHSLLEVFPKTGRTHQIRVHLAFIGCPVVGDNVYGPRKQRIKMKRQFLHAAAITFTLPGSEQTLTVESPLPCFAAKYSRQTAALTGFDRKGRRVMKPQNDLEVQDFTLTDTNGQTVRLSDYRGVKHVVLVFNRGFT